jgi:5'-3' exonuclease
MAKKNTVPPPYDPQRTIYLIDGSSFLYRGYYGLRPLHSPSGEPVQAVYSFCRMIKHLVDRFSPAFLGLVWDSKGKTVRHEMYAEYKATRQAQPSDMADQKTKILQFAEMIGIANMPNKVSKPMICSIRWRAILRLMVIRLFSLPLTRI